MATFREIDAAIEALIYDGVDENGEYLNSAAICELQMERDKKAANLALYVLNLRDEQAAIRQEIDRLTARLRTAEKKEKSIREFLRMVLGGEKLKTPTVSISYRTTTSVDIEDPERLVVWAQRSGHDDLLRYKQPEISKTAVKDLLESGEDVPGATIVTNCSTVIK